MCRGWGLYRYAQPQMVPAFGRYGHKWGIDFCTLVFVLVYRIYSCISRPFTTKKSAQKMMRNSIFDLENGGVDLYTGSTYTRGRLIHE